MREIFTNLEGMYTNIAYNGFFLKEGLQSLGHTLIDLSPYREKNLTQTLASFDTQVDIVLVEFFGDKKTSFGPASMPNPSGGILH